MTLVGYSSSDEQVYKDPNGPGVALWTQLVLHDFRGQIDAIDAGDEVDTQLGAFDFYYLMFPPQVSESACSICKHTLLILLSLDSVQSKDDPLAL